VDALLEDFAEATLAAGTLEAANIGVGARTLLCSWPHWRLCLSSSFCI